MVASPLFFSSGRGVARRAGFQVGLQLLAATGQLAFDVLTSTYRISAFPCG